MGPLTNQTIRELAAVQAGRCVSVFLPTHASGQAVINHQDRLLYKNLLTEVEVEMENRGYGRPETQAFLEPAWRLYDDGEFWRYQDRGLAIFVGPNIVHYYTLPIEPEPFWYLGGEFYLKPLLPLFAGDGRFYLLTLNFHEVKLFEGTRDILRELPVERLLPKRVEEVVGFDYRDKFLGYHGQRQGGHTEVVYHGNAAWQEDEKDEILQFFRAIDRIVADLLAGEKAPLVIASLEHLFPIYREANTYAYLYAEPVTGNPQQVSPSVLHEKAWGLLAPYFDTDRRTKTELLRQFRDNDRTSIDIRHIVPAAIGGRVDTLFLARGEEIWGTYEPRDASVRMHEEQHRSNTSLTNLAAVQTYLNGGQVYLVDWEQLPLPYALVNALYRY